MKIINKYKDIISNKEIISLVRLIPKYKMYLPKTIVLGGGYSILSGFDVKQFQAKYNVNTKSIAIPDKVFDYDGFVITKETVKIVIALLLYHELRHFYQNKTTAMLINYKNDALTTKYEDRTTEIDAYNFTIKFFKKNKDKIKKILKINIQKDWYYDGEHLMCLN